MRTDWRASLRRLSRWSLLPFVTIPLGGCSTLAYYTHTIRGGLELLAGRRSLVAMLQDASVDEELKSGLELAARARDFATRELGLPDNKSYRRYKDIGRPFATWTVTAAPELSLEPLEWCFPVAGCVSYRGYFSRRRAERFATGLAERGFDVDVGGVRAYSTLGWFADPLLNTFVELPEVELVALIFHELAHQRLYVKGDTRFNEAFATAVELEGLRRWLLAESDAATRRAAAAGRRRELDFVALVRRHRDRLARVYAADRADDWKREQKRLEFERLRDDYARLRRSWEGSAAYDAWFEQGLNNARLISVGAYYDLLPAFTTLVLDCRRSLECFYGEAERLARLDAPERAASLEQLARRARGVDRSLLD